MRARAVRILGLVVFGAVASYTLSCANPKQEAATAQALNDAANEIGGLKNDVAQLQTDMDSLKIIVAHQDTVLRQLTAGVPRQ